MLRRKAAALLRSKDVRADVEAKLDRRPSPDIQADIRRHPCQCNIPIFLPLTRVPHDITLVLIVHQPERTTARRQNAGANDADFACAS